MMISSIDEGSIYYMRKTHDYYHIKFYEFIHKGVLIHPAGEIITRPVTEGEKDQYVRDYGCDAEIAIYSDAITRYGNLYWDKGRYIPTQPPVHTSG